MPLSISSRLGRYEVVAPIGAGGMGEVYRARDSKLDRDVAIKVLPESFVQDAERMARFEREAKVLAALNHPNIAAIYGIEDSGAADALVMELAEGPTLADRIRQGAIPLEETLPIARQIAEALEYAHEHGVVHRDLKPANIKVAPDDSVKILDFGLAKAVQADPNSSNVADSPTITQLATQSGLLLGTAAYMSPEQARGKAVDRRADIWAFGCVLYEMLTRQRAFAGEAAAEILAAVLRTEPDWSQLPAATPAHLRVLLRRCLQKDPKQRLRDIGDARLAIEETISGANVAMLAGGSVAKEKPASLLRRTMPWALGAIAILLGGSTAWFALQPRPRQDVLRFTIPEPDNATLILGGMISLSPDGRTLAFVADPGPGRSRVLWLRRLDSLTAQPIPGTDGAYVPFWSPDSQQVGFFADGKLEKVAVSGGTPQTICELEGPPGPLWGSWNRDGVILVAKRDGIFRVPDMGATPTVVVARDPVQAGDGFSHVQFFPDGRHFLVSVNTPGTEMNILAAGSLESKTLQHLTRLNSQVYYAPPGYLLYDEQDTVFARRFDVSGMRFDGPAIPIAQGVGQVSPSFGYFSVSPAGVLAYQAGTNDGRDEMVWFDRKGQKLGTLGRTGVYTDPRISPDGTRLAVVFRESLAISTYDIWIYDLKRNMGSRLTFTPGLNDNPAWSHDGSRIFYSSWSKRDGKTDIYEKPSDGLGNARVVAESGQQDLRLDGISPNGRYAMYMKPTPVASEWVLPLSGDRKPFPWLQDSFPQDRASFSPDGRYVAYVSSETGRKEVYVQTFPQHLGKWQVSTAGGDEPEWRSDGKELFYMAPDNKLMSVEITTSSETFQAGIPKPLFEQSLGMFGGRNSYAPSPDGQRFLMLIPPTDSKPKPITVVVNWPELLKK